MPEWEKTKEIFGAALELEPGRRSDFLRDACGSDQALRAEVESLLAAHASSNDLSQDAWRSQFPAEEQAPGSIGPYQLLRKIGAGGMGQVWLAEQTAPVRRQVAIKLIRAGICDDSLLRRFQAERRSLAIMDHPSIAKVFEAGSTPAGQPYLVMEYVPGPPITDYCDQKRLKIRQRLELFIRVCEGVQHAHQKAIIHRDLKPANILIVEVDGKPVPRIIDFGLAKTTTPEPAGTALLTLAGGFVGTPGYMSPEQAEPGSGDIDTRTDVYSLGVVLYVLLTGYLPLNAKKQPIHEVLRQLREDDPPRPSARIGLETGKAASIATASERATEPEHLAKLLKGDLDWITMKALEKDRTRRYGTPSELAEDIAHYLNNEPVKARPADNAYRLRKYLRRHRLGAAVAVGLVALLAGFTAVQMIQVSRVTRERDRADLVTRFMSGMFKVSDPGEARGNSVTAREILDRSSAEIDSGLARDPELQAQMMSVMGNVYKSLGLYGRAQSLLERAVDTRRRIFGATDPLTLSSMDDLAWTLDRESRFAEAEKLQRETLELRRRRLGPEHPDTLQSIMHLADTLGFEAHYPEAEKLHREALGIKRRVLGPEHPDTLMSMSNLTSILGAQGRYAEAEEIQKQTLEIRRRVLGPEHPETLRSMVFLGWCLASDGHYPEAEKWQQEALEIQRRILGPEHPDTLRSMDNLAWTLRMEDHLAEAEKLLAEALASQRRTLGPEHRDTVGSMRDLSTTLNAQGRYAEAEKLQRETLSLDLRVFGHDRPETAKSMENLAWTLKKQGHYAEAEILERETLAIRRRVLGADHPHTALAAYLLGCMQAIAGRRDEAFLLLREAMDHNLSVTLRLEMETEPDLRSLHGDPRFLALVARVREQRASAEKPRR